MQDRRGNEIRAKRLRSILSALGASVITGTVAMPAFGMTRTARPIPKSGVGVISPQKQVATTDDVLAGKLLADEDGERSLYRHHDEDRDGDAPRSYDDERASARAYEEHEEAERAEARHEGEDRSDELRNRTDEGVNNLRHELKEHGDSN
jgi:hypothetical protein